MDVVECTGFAICMARGTRISLCRSDYRLSKLFELVDGEET